VDEMSIERARLKLGDVVDLARIAGQPTLITRQGKPAAVVVSVDWYEQAKALISEAGRHA
jgi:prevent-host-death family protein